VTDLVNIEHVSNRQQDAMLPSLPRSCVVYPVDRFDSEGWFSSDQVIFLWPPYVIGQAIYIFMLWFLLLLLFSSPNLSGRRLDVYHTSKFHTWCGLSVNLECRSETCCARLAENTARKKWRKSRHLGTIAQHCRAISSQRRHISTIGKKVVKQQYLLHMSP